MSLGLSMKPEIIEEYGILVGMRVAWNNISLMGKDYGLRSEDLKKVHRILEYVRRQRIDSVTDAVKHEFWEG